MALSCVDVVGIGSHSRSGKARIIDRAVKPRPSALAEWPKGKADTLARGYKAWPLLHAQIANRRKDFLHKLSTELVKNNGAIFVGDVNAAGLAKTKMAKSVLDAGWSAFRTMLKYKCDNAAVWFDEVNESYSTQECCACHARTGPKGLADLSVRQWVCSGCGVQHDRDTNAAKNILARGLALMEISLAGEAKAVEAAMNEAVGASTIAGAGHGPLDVGIPFQVA